MPRKYIFVPLLLLGVLAGGLVRAHDAHLADAISPQIAHWKLKDGELRQLVEKQVVARGLSTKNSKAMAGFGLTLSEAAPEAIADAFRTLQALTQSPNVTACGRFSNPPTVEDLAGLSIDAADLFALSRARVGDSGVKLSSQEIERFGRLMETAGRLTPRVKARLTAEYKQMILDRVQAYLQGGDAALGVYADKEEAVDAAAALAGLLQEQAEQAGHGKGVYERLAAPPRAGQPAADSFIFWAVQKYNKLKPVFNVIHMMIHQEGRRVYVASRQIYASHYTEAGLGVAELLPFSDGGNQTGTVIAYTLRLQVDLLGGPMGFLKKRMSRPKLVGALRDSLLGLREHLHTSATVKAP